MKGYTSDTIRNVALLGHGGAGKTTFLEAALLATKVINRLGKVEDGNTVSVNYIKNFTLGIPTVEEQKSILAEIEQKLVQIDKAIEIERGNIKKLQELKARIISDAVTGEIDVRSEIIPEYEYIEDQSDEEADEENIETEEQED